MPLNNTVLQDTISLMRWKIYAVELLHDVYERICPGCYFPSLAHE